MFCRNCGKEITDNPAFCPNCGTRLAAESMEGVSPKSRLAATLFAVVPGAIRCTSVLYGQDRHGSCNACYGYRGVGHHMDLWSGIDSSHTCVDLGSGRLHLCGIGICQGC